MNTSKPKSRPGRKRTGRTSELIRVPGELTGYVRAMIQVLRDNRKAAKAGKQGGLL
jgi:hypothetical protein